MSDDRQQANFDPTPQRLRQAEQEGRFARSHELATALLWTGGIALLALFGGRIWTELQKLTTGNLSESSITIDSKTALLNQWTLTQSLFWSVIAPVLLGFVVIAVLVHSGQIGFRFLPHLAVPKLERVNPLKNFSRLFSREQLLTVALGILKLLVLVVVGAWVLLGEGSLLAAAPNHLASSTFSDWLLAAGLRLCVASVTIGMLDYAARYRIHRNSLKMTEQELRDEQRSMEASPEVAARRRLMNR